MAQGVMGYFQCICAWVDSCSALAILCNCKFPGRLALALCLHVGVNGRHLHLSCLWEIFEQLEKALISVYFCREKVHPSWRSWSKKLIFGQVCYFCCFQSPRDWNRKAQNCQQVKNNDKFIGNLIFFLLLRETILLSTVYRLWTNLFVLLFTF